MDMTTHPDRQPNEYDIELLSAYIDQQLSDAERAALEVRLEREPALRAQLDDLRATVGLLRDLAPVRPPRSFTLDAATVAPRRIWSFPWMQLGSALVAATLLVVFGFVLTRELGRNSPATAPMAASAPTAAPAAEKAPAAARQAVEATAAPAAAAPMLAPANTPVAAAEPTSAPAADSAAPAQATPEVSLVAAPPAEPTASPAPTDDLAQYNSAPAAGSAPQAEAPQPTPPPPGAAGIAAATPGAPIATSGSSSPGTTTLEQPTAPPAPAPAASSPGGVWLALGALLVILALGAWLRLRRR